MKHKAILLIALLVLAVGVACSGTPDNEVEYEVDNTAVAIAEAPAVESSESDPEPVLIMNEANTDGELVETVVADENKSETVRPDGWSEETHGKSADPNYEVVFPSDEVNTMTITIEPEVWQAMLDDMTATYGEPGSGSGPGGRQGGAGLGGPEGLADAPGQGVPGDRPIGPGAADFTTENPIWVAATIEFEEDIWTDVGVRFKGNSSLMNAWSSGSLELPFKLDFDEFCISQNDDAELLK